MTMTVTFNEDIHTDEPSRQAPLDDAAADVRSSTGPSKVFLVEDHELFRSQLARLIAKDPRFILCGESDNASKALEGIETTQPDLVIVDITLKGMNGLDLIRELNSRASGAFTLVLSMHDESMYAERALRAGASGYISKHQTSEELMTAIDRVLSGGVYLSTHMTTELLARLVTAEPELSQNGVGSLSPREMDVFQLMGKGLSTRDIAQQLHLGEKTVHSYRLQIKAKLGIKHSAELYSVAARWVEDQMGTQVGIAQDSEFEQNARA
jgi:DNA-binding NarL/FixJ family response regulator